MPGVKSAYWSWSAGVDGHFSHFERGGLGKRGRGRAFSYLLVPPSLRLPLSPCTQPSTGMFLALYFDDMTRHLARMLCCLLAMSTTHTSLQTLWFYYTASET